MLSLPIAFQKFAKTKAVFFKYQLNIALSDYW